MARLPQHGSVPAAYAVVAGGCDWPLPSAVGLSSSNVIALCPLRSLRCVRYVRWKLRLSDRNFTAGDCEIRQQFLLCDCKLMRVGSDQACHVTSVCRRSGATATLAPVSSLTAVMYATEAMSAAGDILAHSLDSVSSDGCCY